MAKKRNRSPFGPKIDEIPVFHYSDAMPAGKKAAVYKAWVRFLRYDFDQYYFAPALYQHLTLSCAFIAHYDRDGFYAHYFEQPGPQTLRFLQQFAPDLSGVPAEGLSGTYWLTAPGLRDLNEAMCRATEHHQERLRKRVLQESRARDIEEARRLLAQHGIMLPPNIV